ncbi:MAG: DHH family phosphoesterase [Elusimicrobiota bacterium]
MINVDIPQKDFSIIDDILKEIKRAETAFITCHARPDGDALGSTLMLYEVLTALGVDAEMVSPSPPPETYSFLKHVDKIITEVPDDDKDIGFILDSSDTKRLEGVSELLNRTDTIINIDHHKLNEEFGKLNYVRPNYASVCEQVMYLAMRGGVEINKDMAVNVYIGILTDTDRFQEQNTTAQSHKIAADLIEKFINPVEISTLVYGNCSANKMKLIARTLDTLKFAASGKIGYITITPQVLEKTGTSNENVEGIINYARNVKGVEVGILFRKIPGLDGVKVSFRSNGKIDVGSVAVEFGGGGHHNASGCLFKGTFEQAHKQIIGAVEREIKKLEPVNDTKQYG